MNIKRITNKTKIFSIESKAVKMYYDVCNNYRKLKIAKISESIKKTLSFSIFYSKCDHEFEEIFKEEKSNEILKIFGLIINIEEYQNLIMLEENINQEFWLKKNRWNKKLFNWRNKPIWINK